MKIYKNKRDEKKLLYCLAERFSYDKKRFAKELAKHGIQALLTSPGQLTINTINKYLEFKLRGMI